VPCNIKGSLASQRHSWAWFKYFTCNYLMVITDTQTKQKQHSVSFSTLQDWILLHSWFCGSVRWMTGFLQSKWDVSLRQCVLVSV